MSAKPPGPIVAFRALVGVFSLLVLVQAALAGQFLNTQPSARDLHMLLAVAVFPLLSVALVVLGAMVLRRYGPALLFLGTGLLILSVAQTGLGFIGRTPGLAASIHIPLGVALFGLAIFGIGLVKRLPAQA
ncbi:MAG: hypothetical protein ACT4OS_07210 [Acidimicrobiales bacterium]